MQQNERESQVSEVENQETLKLTGRIFWLTHDPELIRAQIDGADFQVTDPELLYDRVSTDQIIPSRWCMSYFDEQNLGRYLLTGVEGIKPGDIAGKFQVIDCGMSFGRGSSREHAQLALKGAGIKVVIARSVERLFRENCINHGIFVLDYDSFQAQKLLETGEITIAEIIEGESKLTGQIIKYGGLMPFTRARLEGKISSPEITTPERDMTIVERIFAQHAKTREGVGVIAVKPGDEAFVEIDSGYAYELQTVISQEVLEKEFGDSAPVKPRRFFLFEDHLALMESDDPVTIRHRDLQRAFAQKYGIAQYKVEEEGVIAICHTEMLQHHVLPGELIPGNDSHTSTLGAANAFAVGKGASEFAAALITEDVQLKVPETIRINLSGEFLQGVTSKDLMLYILSLPKFKDKDKLIGSGRVFEFGGEALNSMPFDDQVVMTNMAVEGQGFTGIVEPNELLVDFMVNQHGLRRADVYEMLVYPDANPTYFDTLDINLGQIEKMVSLPGDTQNAIALAELGDVEIQFAYIGSCAGGKMKDLREAAAVLKGRKIASGVRLNVQAASQKIYEQAQEEGLIEIFNEAGATFIKPGCGDCMGATKEAFEANETAISDSDRNFPGRMGKGRIVYLANPAVVAASAVAGKIIAPANYIAP